MKRSGKMPSESSRKDIINRLRTLKGHIAGIEKMVEEGKNCEDILLQIIEEHAVDCLLGEDDEPLERGKVEKIIKTLMNYMK
jgi:DNA-binding FrmR family transcriptional regulator